MNSWVYGYKYRAVHSSQSPPPADAIDPVAVYYYPTRESSAESQMLCWLSAPGPTAAFKELYFKDGYGADLIDGKEVILRDISVIRQEHVGAKEIGTSISSLLATRTHHPLGTMVNLMLQSPS